MLSLKKQPSTWIICLFLPPLLYSSVYFLYLSISLPLLSVSGYPSCCNPRCDGWPTEADVISLAECCCDCVQELSTIPLFSFTHLSTPQSTNPPCHHPIGSIRAPPLVPPIRKPLSTISIGTACGWKGEWHPPVYNSWDALSLLPHYSSRRKQIFQTMRLNWCIYVPNWL